MSTGRFHLPMKFDRKTFFDQYRAKFGGLVQTQVLGLERLLDCLENDPYIKDIRHAAYILATVKHETADTFTPIHEYGGKAYFIKRYGGQTKKGKELGNDTPEEGYYYAGKGDVQATGEANYEKAETAIRKEYPKVVAEFEKRTGKTFDLTVGDQPNDELDPQNMLDPVISYVTMSYGMRTGMFTGKKLTDFIKGPKCDYYNCRTVVNGHDKANLISGYAEDFEAMLRASKTNSAKATDTATDKGVMLTEQPPESSNPSPIDPPTSETKTEVVQTGDVTTAVATTTPAGDAPDVPPTNVSKNGLLAKWLFSSGIGSSVAAAVWAWITGNASIIAVAIICVTALIAMFMFRGAITDAIRMQVAADPSKKNVT